MDDEQQAKIFKALSNPQRLKLFKLLYEWQGDAVCIDSTLDVQGIECCGVIEKSFTKACCYLDLSRSTISHHFKELENAGLITCTRHGKHFECMVNRDSVVAVRQFLV